MKLPSGKRLGQSEYELALAVFYSFFLHAAVVFVALFLHFLVFPKSFIPPSYQVKLVGQPKDLKPTPAGPAAALPKEDVTPAAAKPAPLPQKAVERNTTAPDKTALPGPGKLKQKPAVLKQTQENETAQKELPAVFSPEAEASSAEGNIREGVGVTPQQDFKYSWYLDIVSGKIRQNWNPPPDSADAKARVIFTVNRSGRVITLQLDEDQSGGSFSFKQAARRAIQASDPFPPLPDDFYKQSLEFSVDLVPEK